MTFDLKRPRATSLLEWRSRASQTFQLALPTGPLHTQQFPFAAESLQLMLRDTIILVTLTGAAAGLSYLATLSHAGSGALPAALIAWCLVLFGSLPPLLTAPWISRVAAFPIAVVAWRLLAMLASLFLIPFWPEPARNCFSIALLACYFVALPLESWLLVGRIGKN